MTTQEPPRGGLRQTLLVFLALLATYACFLQHPLNWNVVPRAATSIAMVTNGSTIIDDWADRTGDRAFFDGHYYSDKAPGLSLLALPATAIALTITKVEPEDTGLAPWNFLVFFCTVSTCGLLSALAGTALFIRVRRVTGSMGTALAATVFFGVASPVFGWSTAFFGHAATTALLLLGFLALDGERRTWRSLFGGVCLGLAVLVEYTASVAAALIGAVLFVRIAMDKGIAPALRAFVPATLVGLAAAAPSLIYNAVSFGSPFSLGYGNLQAFEGMKEGVFGISTPKPMAIAHLLVGPRAGLLWIAPGIIPAALGALLLAARDKARRHVGIAALLVAAWYFLSNAGYAYWHGGFSTGPRHFTPAFGLLALALGLALPNMPRWARVGSVILVAMGVVPNLLATGVTMAAPAEYRNAWFDLIIPHALSGEFNSAITNYVFPQKSLLHLAPVLAVWTSFTVLWVVVSGARRTRA